MLNRVLAGMRSVWSKFTHTPQRYSVDSIRFVREQVGETETDFMVRVAPILARDARVKRGYLARVVYADAGEEHVALCLVAKAPDEALVSEIGSLFSAMFRREEHLDTIFVRAEEEVELAAVCSPFFDSMEA